MLQAPVSLRGFVAALAAALASAALPAAADGGSAGHRVSAFVSGAGNAAFLAAGAFAPLLEDGRRGRGECLRAVDAMATSVLFSEGLKRLTREGRPGGGAANSFPSGHATAAFAIATAESAIHPEQSAAWYAGAALIGASRVSLHRHYVHDVLAGAALGYGVARWEISRPRGLALAPWIQPDTGSAGLQLRRTW